MKSQFLKNLEKACNGAEIKFNMPKAAGDYIIEGAKMLNGNVYFVAENGSKLLDAGFINVAYTANFKKHIASQIKTKSYQVK